ncbi:hypothetical protein K435DRAFT_862363 [Dendrothele bispora CBS 962.96]|uniref:Uncharacterized protein n=1 Tax=Dendrothele bispora (strain CBS 962.96) TaxID=1314807 RepID=A0A4S8LSU8_DENBC|nr:hypothetical protein K435DRAFT_862363 [Dendrothele bispora CBS 962.96]
MSVVGAGTPAVIVVVVVTIVIALPILPRSEGKTRVTATIVVTRTYLTSLPLFPRVPARLPSTAVLNLTLLVSPGKREIRNLEGRVEPPVEVAEKVMSVELVVVARYKIMEDRWDYVVEDGDDDDDHESHSEGAVAPDCSRKGPKAKWRESVVVLETVMAIWV